MMHAKKLESVTAMAGPARYHYFVRSIADSQVVWGLFNEGWAQAASDEGRRALPFWPESEFAEVCATSQWAEFKPKIIPLEDFHRKWLQGMEKDGVVIAVFPTPQERGVFVDPSRLTADLKAEEAQYE